MKRFTFLAFLFLGIGCIALAATPKEKTVKFEVPSYVDQHVISAVEVADYNVLAITNESEDLFIADTEKVDAVINFKPPSVIEKINSDYNLKLYKEPIAKNLNLLPDIRRLSWVSVVAGSYRHS